MTKTESEVRPFTELLNGKDVVVSVSQTCLQTSAFRCAGYNKLIYKLIYRAKGRTRLCLDGGLF